MMNKTKVVVLYRVLQQWRAPIFEELNLDENIELSIWHGPDFKNSKLISSKKSFTFSKKKLLSFRLKFKSTNGSIMMPFSPFLFFSLIIKNPDVIIAEGASNIINSIQGFLYAKLFGKKFIWWSLGKLKNRVYDSKRSKIDSLIQFIERSSSAIISYSSRGKEYFESIGVNRERIFVAVNVVDTAKILKNKAVDLDKYYKLYHDKYEFVVLFVGALTKEKEIEKLLYAQQLLENNTSNVGLLIVGDGSHANALKKLSSSLQLHNVEFLGNRIEDSYQFFAASDLFILPGLGGLAISEAMCYKLPVICSIGDGCEVDLVTSSNGIIDENLDSAKIYKYILDFKNDKNMLESFGSSSLDLITKKYNTANYVKNIKSAIYN